MDNNLLKQRVDEMSEKFEDVFNRNAILSSLDMIAIEAMKLDIPDWANMKIGQLRAEIKLRHEAKKK